MAALTIPEGVSFSEPEQKAEVSSILQDQLEHWSDFPLAKLHELSHGNSLVLVSWFALHKSGMVSSFGIDGVQLFAFLREVQSLYHDNPYHCAMHAADVTQGTYSLMCATGLFQSLPPIEALALLLSAIVHDVDHPGVNNIFLVNSESPLAFLYNDTSVLENHHLATAFKLLQQPELHWTSVLSKADKATMRKCMIKNILHTDMALHRSGLQEVKSLPDTCRQQPAAFATWAPDHRQVFNQSLLHLADLGASLRNFQSSLMWGLRITQEFLAQGEQEVVLGLPVGPTNAKDQPPLSKTQPGFIQHMVMPLCQAMSEFGHPIFQELLDNGSANMKLWSESCAAAEPPRKKSR